MKNILVSLFVISTLITLSSCSYMKNASIQAEYAQIQQADPGQVNLKHMIDRETYFVIGQTIDKKSRYTSIPLAVAAYSSKYKANERVDTMYFAGAGTHFGLNLPEGDYQLLVFADLDNNQVFDSTEVVGQKTISLNQTTSPDKVLDRINVELSSSQRIDWVETFSKPNLAEPKKSLYFPTGSIRSLEDPLFSENMATLGMYDPASFLEKAPTMFYALEEDLAYKIPVVFVHGIGGSVRDFETIVSRLDRKRYKPWFFYYPSGGDLNQLAEFFHRIFLFGKVIKLNEMPMIIVAHSMGGLIVREALNKYDSDQKENKIGLVVTIASPFGGHPSAALGEKHGLIVLPSWRDLNPESRFIKELFRKPLPKTVEHQLFYAYDNPATLKISKNSDGVVPLSSQLRLEAQQQATGQLGFESSHTGILKNEEMIDFLFTRMNRVKNFFPESHLAVFRQGGYDVKLTNDYSPQSQYVIHTMGKYWMAVSKGTLKPFYPEQERFLRVVKGEEPPKYKVVKDWL
ncbi:lipase family alpha/beta hydrolase, partial [Thiomicrorhabdus sp.]|uniref:lipase family alpha/beta hydrolase n=1 Tax=Thiomicrorhabdus sp. TaxID=2039724 RepID=UPI003563E8C6